MTTLTHSSRLQSVNRPSKAARPNCQSTSRSVPQPAKLAQRSASELPEDRMASSASTGAETRSDYVPSDLLAAAKCGDHDALTALLGRYRALWCGAARAFARDHRPGPSQQPGLGIIEVADLEQEAAIEFCRLVGRYDPTRGTNFTTYIQRTLHWRLTNYLRQESRRRAGHRAPVELLEDIADTAAELPDHGIRSPKLARALQKLSPRQRMVVAGLFWRERTPSELGRELGVSQQAVSRARDRAFARIRGELAGADYRDASRVEEADDHRDDSPSI